MEQISGRARQRMQKEGREPGLSLWQRTASHSTSLFPQHWGLCSWQVDGPVFEAGVWLIQKPEVSFPSHQAASLSNE